MLTTNSKEIRQVTHEIYMRGFHGNMTPRTERWVKKTVEKLIHYRNSGMKMDNAVKVCTDRTFGGLSDWLFYVQQSWHFVSRALKEFPDVKDAAMLFQVANRLMVQEIALYIEGID